MIITLHAKLLTTAVMKQSQHVPPSPPTTEPPATTSPRDVPTQGKVQLMIIHEFSNRNRQPVLEPCANPAKEYLSPVGRQMPSKGVAFARHLPPPGMHLLANKCLTQTSPYACIHLVQTIHWPRPTGLSVPYSTVDINTMPHFQ